MDGWMVGLAVCWWCASFEASLGMRENGHQSGPLQVVTSRLTGSKGGAPALGGDAPSSSWSLDSAHVLCHSVVCLASQ
jgi:hypothetical protein